jgi:hypothetical protein
MLQSMKKLLIALLSINALLTALLTAQAAQAAWTKSEITRVSVLEKRVDAVKLAEYSACLADSVATDWLSGNIISWCAKYKP